MATLRAKVNASGRVVIPSELRKQLGIKAGDQLLFEVKGRELRMTTLRERIAKVQREMKKYFPPGTRLSDELIAERREAAKHE